MKHLRKFNESIINIEKICQKYGIENVNINKDGSVDVNGDVDLSNKSLNKLPLKFNKVSGNFECQDNNLRSLRGAPNHVGGDFNCYGNELINLIGGPNYVSNFDCSSNELITLEGAPQNVDMNFDCYKNELVNLIGVPKYISGGFDCSYNKLITFEGAPKSIGTYFDCYNNPIYVIYKLFNDIDHIELFNEYDMFRDNPYVQPSVILDLLNSFLMDIGKEPVTEVKGYDVVEHL